MMINPNNTAKGSITEKQLEQVKDGLAENPDLTLKNLIEAYSLTISPSGLCHKLKRYTYPPASEFFVVTHEWVYKTDEAFPLIGKTVGYAHSEEAQAKIPDGYERYNNHLHFIERFNFKYDESEFRTEVWFAIRKIADKV